MALRSRAAALALRQARAYSSAAAAAAADAPVPLKLFGTAGRYATALYKAAVKSNALPAVSADIKAFGEAAGKVRAPPRGACGAVRRAPCAPREGNSGVLRAPPAPAFARVRLGEEGGGGACRRAMRVFGGGGAATRGARARRGAPSPAPEGGAAQPKTKQRKAECPLASPAALARCDESLTALMCPQSRQSRQSRALLRGRARAAMGAAGGTLARWFSLRRCPSSWRTRRCRPRRRRA